MCAYVVDLQPRMQARNKQLSWIIRRRATQVKLRCDRKFVMMIFEHLPETMNCKFFRQVDLSQGNIQWTGPTQLIYISNTCALLHHSQVAFCAFKSET